MGNNQADSNSKIKDQYEEQETLNKSELHKKADASPIKIVVRRLPPSFTKEGFYELTKDHSSNIIWWTFIPARKGELEVSGVPKFSRGYVVFSNSKALSEFAEPLKNKSFFDEKGSPYSIIMELAPYQKFCTEKRKPDPRMGTISRDEDYLEFCSSLKM